MLAHPENMALVKRLIGLEELVVPDEESRTKQYREIVQWEVILPSIMPEEFADNHPVELEICMRWFSPDAAQVVKIEAPLGYANVRAHALFHRDYLRKQQAVVLGASTSNSPQMNTDKRI